MLNLPTLDGKKNRAESCVIRFFTSVFVMMVFKVKTLKKYPRFARIFLHQCLGTIVLMILKVKALNKHMEEFELFFFCGLHCVQYYTVLYCTLLYGG